MKHGYYDIWDMEIDAYKQEFLSEMYDDTSIDFVHLYCEEIYPFIRGLKRVSENLWQANVNLSSSDVSDQSAFDTACLDLKKHFDLISAWSACFLTVNIPCDMSLFDAYNYIINVKNRVLAEALCIKEKRLSRSAREQIKDRLPVYQRAMNKVKLELSNFTTDQEDNRKKIIEIDSRVKTLDSIEEKIYRKGISQYEALQAFDDIAGVRCVCEYLDDVYDVLNYIRGNPLIDVIEIDDKIEKASDQGYRGIHTIVQVGVYFQGELHKNVNVEVQLRTAFQNAWSTKTHDLTYKKEGENLSEVQDAMKKLSDILLEADKVALEMKKQVAAN